MAFTALALRLATVLALRGRTIAGDRVMDSAITPVDQRVADERKPALAVYTDDLSSTPEGRDLLSGDRSLQLVIEIVVANQVEHEGEVTIIVPETDEGLELTINLAERQVLRALQAEAATWPDIWRGLVLKIIKVESQRGAGEKGGVRFAGRQLLLTVQPLAEPGFGAPASGVWRDFLDALGLEPDFATLVPLLEAEFEGEPLTDWRQVQAMLGLTLDGVRGLGVAPVFDAAPDEDAPLFGRLTLAGDDGDRIIEPEA